MIRIAVIACNETEDLELIGPVDLWRRAGFRVDTVSLEKKNTIILNSGVKVSCDKIIETTNLEQYNAIYLPGGSGHRKYFVEEWPPRNNDGVVKLQKALSKFHASEKTIIAMCAAPSILGTLGFLKDIKATCYPGFETTFEDTYVDAPVVVDKHIITGRSPAAVFDLSFTVIKELQDQKLVDKVKKEIISY